ncbi:hypothetical protein RJ55_08649 [Drechmeria coniospora]|nr:hypothetical protein RJ55_08649 [Drechmeria coniospora]
MQKKGCPMGTLPVGGRVATSREQSRPLSGRALGRRTRSPRGPRPAFGSWTVKVVLGPWRRLLAHYQFCLDLWRQGIQHRPWSGSPTGAGGTKAGAYLYVDEEGLVLCAEPAGAARYVDAPDAARFRRPSPPPPPTSTTLRHGNPAIEVRERPATTASVMAETKVFGVPIAGEITSMLLSMISTTVLTLFITRRSLAIKVWSRLPLVSWLVFAIYVDSYLFVFATAILQHAIGINMSLATCEGAILLCLVCYVTTKFLYLFLVEKAHIIRGTPKRRLKSRLYLFNSFGMLGVYLVVAVLNFVFRIAKMEDGMCVIGMKSLAMIPLISFDAVVNIYLTFMFIIPLRRLHSFKNMPRSPANMRLRKTAFRTFFGALFTLISSVVNLTVLMAMGGQPGWVCLMCCNGDILFSAIILQWVTTGDNHHGPAKISSSGGDTARGDPSTLSHMKPPRSMEDRDSIFSKARASPNDLELCDGDNMKQSGIVITTTIRHESGPHGQGTVGQGPVSANCSTADGAERASQDFLVPDPQLYPRQQTSIVAGMRAGVPEYGP